MEQGQGIRTWLVERTWIVEAVSATEAIEATMGGKLLPESTRARVYSVEERAEQIRRDMGR